MYQNADEIEKLKKIKEDSDPEVATALKQLKDMSESWDLMQQELVELREVRCRSRRGRACGNPRGE